MAQLAASGAPLHRLLRASRLDEFNLEDPVSFVPSCLVYEFLKRVQRKELSAEPANDLKAGYRFRHMAHFGDGVLTAPTMLTAVKRAADPRGTISTQNFVDLEVNGSTVTITDRFEHQSDRDTRLIENLSLCPFIDGIVHFAGLNCRPLRVEVTAEKLLDHTIPIDLRQTRVLCNKTANRVTVPLAWLGKRPPIEVTAANEPAWAPEDNFPSKLFAFFDGLQPGLRPDLSFTADCAGISPRSIQRLLREESTSFFELLDQWLFGKEGI